MKVRDERLGGKRSQGKHKTDTLVAMAATEAIGLLTTIPPEKIKVSFHNGWLKLEGKVAWQHQRTTVEDITRHLPGVKGVINSIGVES